MPISNNIRLKVENDKRFHFQTFSTIGSGITKGDWKVEGNSLKLFADKKKIDSIKLSDSIYEIQEEYRPFSDSLLLKIKSRRLYPENKNFYLEKE